MEEVKTELSKTKLVPIESVIITKRARTDLGDIDELATSIEKRGLINAICVDDSKGKLELIAGYRRLTCCKQLGWKHIEVKFYKDLSPMDLKELELEENIHKELSWDEKAALRAEIHLLKQKKYGKAVKGHESSGWGIKETAESLSVSLGTLSTDIQLVNAMDKLPRLRGFSSRKQAIKFLNKAKERAILSELAKRDKEKEEKSKGKGSSKKLYEIHFMNALKFLKMIKDESVDLILTDPPFGVDIDAQGSSSGKREKANFDDTEEATKTLLEQVIPEFYRILRPNRHCYMFFGFQLYSWVLEQFKKQKGFIVREIPLIWTKPGGGFTDFEVKFMPSYEPFLFVSKGIRGLDTAKADVFPCARPPSTERIHTQQKPVDLLKTLIKTSSLPNEIVVDPFIGSGSVIVSSILLGRRAWGSEDNKENYNAALNWIKGSQPEEDISGDES